MGATSIIGEATDVTWAVMQQRDFSGKKWLVHVYDFIGFRYVSLFYKDPDRKDFAVFRVKHRTQSGNWPTDCEIRVYITGRIKGMSKNETKNIMFVLNMVLDKTSMRKRLMLAPEEPEVGWVVVENQKPQYYLKDGSNKIK